MIGDISKGWFGPASRAIVIYGHARGGTNILWNGIGSHEDVLMTNNELNELFGTSMVTRSLRKLPQLLSFGVFNKILADTISSSVFRSLSMDVLGERQPGVKYEYNQLPRCILCYKGVNLDTGCHSALMRMHGSVKSVILLRHPAFVINGHVRRGWAFEDSWKRYVQTLRGFERVLRTDSSAIVLDFDALVAKPVDEIKSIFRQIGLPTRENITLRFKAKKRSTNEGHQVVAGYLERQHYWIREDEIDQMIDKRIIGRVNKDQAALSKTAGFDSDKMIQATNFYEKILQR